ncbi:MAG TPA: Holliday junction resolvase RecU [Globicatella sulfidifaciens]|uniref:Holliday junction resolvase RecU n=2 Tax=Globicatella sulfidifaciens TaxID=136093 RepID=A0A1T4K085_9LACT|nr:Holliday junction resolvase RecU [Globicatella sulfidifaciens]MDT2767825.1 Holliday junction resolvase RecU [Globicatella sulfidifaciens]NLJ17895.1 Holliday junction resolvase RecU [Globicatella sulfidifaciens]SJZ35727.1 recombination protein U [Globicatella sulfidifaciens DSM 15739]HJF16924.1 Holliday junction resolvase RecU [Globicatella sulfidifaciens]
MINYPTGSKPNHHHTKKTEHTHNTIYGSRGMSLEDKINQSNEYYLTHHLAVIHKKPTPVQVVKVDYPRRSAAKIVEAYYRHASTTDYNGVYQGFYIDFEAKETKNKTSFPLANLPEHQRTHMLQCIEQGGIAFLILSFAAHNETYIIPYEKVDSEIKKSKKQSLTYEFIKQEGFLCKEGLFPIIDYLAALDQYIESRE